MTYLHENCDMPISYGSLFTAIKMKLNSDFGQSLSRSILYISFTQQSIC